MPQPPETQTTEPQGSPSAGRANYPLARAHQLARVADLRRQYTEALVDTGAYPWAAPQ